MYHRLFSAAVIASLCFAKPLAAQDANAPMTPQPIAGDTAGSRSPQPSLMDKPSDFIRRREVLAAPVAADGQNLGEAKAEMAVGGAGIVVGALIGGDGGSVLMFGGALVGLYGLWNYLK
jgi:hypothetical protein